MSHKPINILLIEDNPGDVRLIQEMLAEANSAQFALKNTDRLSTGLELLARGGIDLALLDLSLPDSHGLDTFVKMHAEAPQVPFVLLTGLDDESLALKAVQVGAQDYLVKGNVDSHSLARAIRYGIERRQAEEEIRRRNRELTLLNRIIAASAVTPNVELESILEIACCELALAFNVPQATAILMNEDKTTARVVAEYLVEGRPPALHTVLSIADNPLFQHLLQRKTPLVADDVQSDPRLAPIHEIMRQRGAVSLLLLPLIIGGEVVGSLGLDAIEPRQFSNGEVSLAWRVADQVAGVLARTQLDKERLLLSTAIEQTAEGVIITDVEGAILYVNPAFEQITGYSRAEAVGKEPRRLLDSGKHNDAFYQELRAVTGAGQVWDGRVINKNKDGAFYTADVTISPVRDNSGAIINYVEVQRDVTREVELEEQYLQAQKMEAIGQLTGGIAHDFNNLLTAINGFAELVQSRLPADSPFKGMVENILGSGQRAADLVKQLMAFSRKQVIEPKVLDLNEVMANMDKMLQRIIGEDIELKTNLSPKLWPVKVDPAQIEQVIVNLAVNARDAMPEGGRLTLETTNIALSEDYIAQHWEAQPGDYVLLGISDSGVGMSQEVQAHIFEPFFTTKEKGQGTGLGLATVFGIVKQSGGNIQVYSEEGRGTSFKIYLPVAGETSQPLIHSQDEAGIPSGSETLLLVEDDTRVRELARQVLQGQGYIVLEAQNPQEALLLSSRYTGPIQLMLTDVVMPGMTGKALAEELSQTRPDLKVLYMSGYTDSTIAHHGVLEAGVAFLQKPFSLRALARKVRAVLDS
jgi:PAS domain S-box-containing protein